MNQLIDNLISNAIKYTPEGGTHGGGGALRDEGIHVEVRDTGVGIPADELEKLFMRFFRASTSGSRRAPGWACRSSSRSSRRTAGRSTSGASSGEGTTFLVDLPLEVRARARHGHDHDRSEHRMSDPASDGDQP
jgi:signal transduction histidine kinase